MDIYKTENLYKYWLFYGEYYAGIISKRTKSFQYYVDCSKYNPEQLLFQVHRNYLDSSSVKGIRIKISPDSLIQDPEVWFSKAITAIYHQCKFEKDGKDIFISNCSRIMAIEKSFDQSRLEFSKCGIEYYRIQQRSLKSLTEYPEAINLK